MKKDAPAVMVIEDEVLLLQAITKKLQLNGIEVVSCRTGLQALDYLKNLPQLPDLIWLDYYLGDLDGLDLLKRIKENKKWSRIPVCVVSNSANPEKVHNMLDLGAEKYYLKAEHRLEDIIREVVEIINKARKQ